LFLHYKIGRSHYNQAILDFYHATGYLEILAEVLHPKQIPEQKEWLKNSCHQLKHELKPMGFLLLPNNCIILRLYPFGIRALR
jgi:hypothetical protein